VLEYIERKAEGEDIVVEEQAPEAEEKVVDLMAALEASLAAARKNGSQKKTAPKKRAPQKRKSA
jgi:DNA end-binding protein Ku